MPKVPCVFFFGLMEFRETRSGVISWNWVYFSYKNIKSGHLAKEKFIRSWADSRWSNCYLYGQQVNYCYSEYHAIREAEKSKEINLEHCNLENQIAEIMTKALSKGIYWSVEIKAWSIEKSQGEVLEIDILIITYLMFRQFFVSSKFG